MKNNVLRATRSVAMQPPSGELMDATRPIRKVLRTMSAVPDSASTDTDTPAPWHSPVWLRQVPRSVMEGKCARVDSQEDVGQSPDATDSSANFLDEQFITGDFVHADASVNYQLYMPPAAVRNGSLLVMLHGCTQESTDFSIGTAMNALARDTGYTVLYPNQNSSSNPNRCWNWFLPAHQQRGGGEPALLGALTQSVCAALELDPARVFVAGLSAGGAMALILAEEFPEIYAGVGVHSGLATGMANSTAQAFRAMTGGGKPAPLHPSTTHRPTLVIHGDDDRTVHPHNANVIVQRCLDQYRQQNSEDDVVSRSHDEAVDNQSAHRHEYRNHGGDIVCRHLQLGSIGHAWSGGDARGSHTAVGGVSASESLLSFFDQCPSLST